MVNQKNNKKSQKSNKRVKKGGSLASDKVMKVANGVGMTVDDYSKMPLPKMGSLKKQVGAGSCASKQKGGASCASKQKGGASCAKKQSGAGGCGSNKGKRTKCRSVNSRRRTKKVQRKGQKGAGFLNMAGCGPVNAPDAGRKYAKHFSKTSSCPGPEFYANPPELAKAGSGSGNAYPFN